MTLKVLVSWLIHAVINIFEFNFIEGKLELDFHALFSVSYSQCARQQSTGVEYCGHTIWPKEEAQTRKDFEIKE